MKINNMVNRHPVASYFIATFGLSWLGAFIVVASDLLNNRAIQKMEGLIMFPLMILGPGLAGVVLELMTGGREGLRNLLKRMSKWKLAPGWYFIALLVPPCLIALVLFSLSHFFSSSFKMNFFPIGILFGLPAGFFEEIGWTGYAMPRLLGSYSKFRAGIILGLAWGFWHLPVIDFLGTATPHKPYLFFFFFGFILILTAMRALMTWVYSNTGSVLIVQIMHAVSTGCLVMLGPNGVTSKQEAVWYTAYGVMLSLFTIIIYALAGSKSFHEKKTDCILIIVKKMFRPITQTAGKKSVRV